MLKHVCGACTKIFKSEADYLKHVCSVTHYSPKEVEHALFQPKSFPKTIDQKETILSEGEILTAVRAARQAKLKNAKI